MKIKNSRDYVLNHQYGYGLEKEKRELNKLKLRIFEDLKVYLEDILENAFNATYKNNILEFNIDKSKFEIIFEQSIVL